MTFGERTICGVLLALGLAAGAGLIAWARPVEVILSQADMQQRVSAKLPLEATKGPFHVRVDTAEVQVRPDARLGVVASFHAEAVERTAHGRVTLSSGTLTYAPGEGAFYLRSAALETVSVEIGRVNPDEAASPGRVRLAARALGQAVLAYTGLDDNLAALRDASIETFRERATKATVDAFNGLLDHQAVYQLPQDQVRHPLAKLTLSGVLVRDGALVATLDRQDSVGRVMGWLLVVVSVFGALGLLVNIATDDGKPSSRRSGAYGSSFIPTDCCFASAVMDTTDAGCCLAESATSFGGIDCFVATASLQAESRPAHPDLVALRALRDQVLARSAAGRLFSRLYYRWGRYPAAAIRGRRLPCLVVKTLLVQPMASVARWLMRN